MRVMENMAVYKARLNGGSAPLTTSSDIARGSNGPQPYQTLRGTGTDPFTGL